MSIALALFCFSPKAHVIAGVQTVSETRLERLLMLIEQAGSLAALNESIGLERTDATLSQIKNRSPHHKTGKPRSMGDDMARRLEDKRGLPVGWMDTPASLAVQFGGTGPLHKLAEIMALMEPEMQYKVVRMVAALNEPANGTDGVQH